MLRKVSKLCYDENPSESKTAKNAPHRIWMVAGLCGNGSVRAFSTWMKALKFCEKSSGIFLGRDANGPCDRPFLVTSSTATKLKQVWYLAGGDRDGAHVCTTEVVQIYNTELVTRKQVKLRAKQFNDQQESGRCDSYWCGGPVTVSHSRSRALERR